MSRNKLLQYSDDDRARAIRAELAFRRVPGYGSIERYCGTPPPAGGDCCLTSHTADLSLIVWHWLYWAGKIPDAIAPTRGSAKYRVRDTFGERIVQVRDPRDHRSGIDNGLGQGGAR